LTKIDRNLFRSVETQDLSFNLFPIFTIQSLREFKRKFQYPVLID